MTIEAKVIADSISTDGIRLTTMQLRYPRFIHAEFMTHRLFSRNASSSRAIPVEKQIEMILEDTAMPFHWGKNQPGMQAHEECEELVYGPCGSLDMVMNEVDGATREEAWYYARDRAIEVALAFHHAGYHKQIVNRILEPFSHISVVVTATDYDNFFWLRRHKDAQPEIKILADNMHLAMEFSTPRKLTPHDWHVPYVREDEITHWRQNWKGEGIDGMPMELHWWAPLIKLSVARCARVSYLTHDGKKPDMEKDFALYDRLVGSEPLHASPAEHQARPDWTVWDSADLKAWQSTHLHGNLNGYVQFRKLLPGEHHTTWEGLNAFE